MKKLAAHPLTLTQQEISRAQHAGELISRAAEAPAVEKRGLDIVA